ncbi:MAG TPA: hypothetical protein VF669_06120 [Tepidisphaeraceae bacterium]|jgi:hypothetical protein
MSIHMVCPDIRCRHIHSFPNEARGQVIKCLKCETKFRIPAPRLSTPTSDVPKDLKVPAAPFVF